jgi:predicted TIM-barrel fold metal-dependent hydrolase
MDRAPKIVEKVEELGGKDHVVFGSCLPAEPKHFMERAMVESTPRDPRNWAEIRDWAKQIASQLVAVPS